MMPNGILAAQSAYDLQQSPDCYAPDERTQEEALRNLLNRACRLAQSHVDCVEVGVSGENEGDYVVSIAFWPVKLDTKRALADALNRIAAELLK